MLNLSKFFPAPKSECEARHQANVLSKAERLQRDGYSFAQIDDETVFVTKPDGTKYEVDLIFEECNCPGFQKDRFCSHLIGTLLWKEENDAADRQAEEEADGRLLMAETATEFALANSGYRF